MPPRFENANVFVKVKGWPRFFLPVQEREFLSLEGIRGVFLLSSSYRTREWKIIDENKVWMMVELLRYFNLEEGFYTVLAVTAIRTNLDPRRIVYARALLIRVESLFRGIKVLTEGFNPHAGY